MQGGARLTACYSLLERSSSERTRRPTPARPPNGRSICFGDAGPEPAELRASAASRGCYNPRRSAARPARVGRVGRAPPALGGLRRCGMGVYAFAAARRGGLCARAPLAPRARLGWPSGWLIAPPGLCPRAVVLRAGAVGASSSRRRRARRPSSAASPPSAAPPPRIRPQACMALRVAALL